MIQTFQSFWGKRIRHGRGGEGAGKRKERDEGTEFVHGQPYSKKLHPSREGEGVTPPQRKRGLRNKFHGVTPLSRLDRKQGP